MPKGLWTETDCVYRHDVNMSHANNDNKKIVRWDLIESTIFTRGTGVSRRRPVSGGRGRDQAEGRASQAGPYDDNGQVAVRQRSHRILGRVATGRMGSAGWVSGPGYNQKAYDAEIAPSPALKTATRQ